MLTALALVTCVDDYRDIDPKIGTLEDFDEMVAALHAAGIRVIVDIVPNHSSDRHEWFQEALAAQPGSAARDRYIFRDGRGENGDVPPADWTAMFGGPSWTRITEPHGTAGQWYLHLFAKEQPDFNWANPEVRADFRRTLRFWSDRGVDGFRIDVAHALTKDLGEPLPSQAEGLGQAFNFDLLEAHFSADEFREIVTFNLELSVRSGSSSTWVLSNHDVVRHPTRYGLAPKQENEEKAGTNWLVAGCAYLYQGEELGLHEVAEIPDADRQDPTFFNSPGTSVGRDGCLAKQRPGSKRHDLPPLLCCGLLRLPLCVTLAVFGRLASQFGSGLGIAGEVLPCGGIEEVDPPGVDPQLGGIPAAQPRGGVHGYHQLGAQIIGIHIGGKVLQGIGNPCVVLIGNVGVLTVAQPFGMAQLGLDECTPRFAFGVHGRGILEIVRPNAGEHNVTVLARLGSLRRYLDLTQRRIEHSFARRVLLDGSGDKVH